MPAQSAWDIAQPILDRHFKDVIHPLFFGNKLTVEHQLEMRGRPRPYIISAMELIMTLGGGTIVEIGCMRKPLTHPIEEDVPYCCNDGHSTAFWGLTGLDVHSADIDPEAVKVASHACAKMDNVRVQCCDGIEFLKNFEGSIDLLYLDAWDVTQGSPFAEKHLEAFDVVRDKLAPQSIVLIDDTDMAYGGKGRLAVPAIVRAGFDLLLTGRQTMLMRV